MLWSYDSDTLVKEEGNAQRSADGKELGSEDGEALGLEDDAAGSDDGNALGSEVSDALGSNEAEPVRRSQSVYPLHRNSCWFASLTPFASG